MHTHELPLNIFVSHSFEPRSKSYNLEAFRESVKKAMELASEILKGKKINVRITPIFESNIFGSPLNQQIISSIQSSSCAIVDLTNVSANVMYELGYIDALSIPCLLTRSAHSTAQIPVDVAGRLFAEYQNESNLPTILSSSLASVIESSLRGTRIIPSDRDFVWFPHDIQGIHVVCPHSPDNLFTADMNHPNYVYLEQFSDKDALLEIMVFLSRTYSARVHKYTAMEFPQRQLLRDNIVVIGGPGIKGIGEGNIICREMMRRISTRLTYALNGESLIYRTPEGDIERRPVYSGDGQLKIDYGYFARFPNPFEPKAVVILVNGLHTAGVLGSALVLSDRPQAAQNFRVIKHALGRASSEAPAFEALFEVERMAGEVLVPRLSANLIFPLEPK
ncbi:hypothetical protein [Azospirillum cavernae]|uniref:hypothetical protein n=1 Tax=Azospirillum cavernae TaxID=2320860 RepID=UPI0011C37B6F|nr:hypothetical protein [Azospirillum cavernae]